MGKIISMLALIIMIVLFPPAALITISQGAVPGDRTYPIKRSLEDGVLFLASFNPVTKAYFAVARSNRRYEETASLLSKGSSAGNSLLELVEQTNLAASDINNISNSGQKAKLIADLSGSIEKYDQGLAQAQQEITKNTSISSPAPTSQLTPKAPETTSTPQPKASAKSAVSAPAVSAQPGLQATPQVTPTPSPKPTSSPADNEAKKKQEEIERARKELEELRKRLEEEQKKLQLESQKVNMQSTSNPSLSPSPAASQSPKPSPVSKPKPSVKNTSRNFSKDSKDDKNQNFQSDQEDNEHDNEHDNED